MRTPLTPWLVALAFCGCVRTYNKGGGSSPKIIGGIPLSEEHVGYKSSVAISYANKEGAEKIACSGVLVAENLVVTAAHCIVYDRGYFPYEPRWVYWGQQITPGQSPRNKVVGVRIHPKYTGRNIYRGSYQFFDDDIATLEIEGPLPLGKTPAKILPDNPQVRSELAGKELALTGYGYTDASNENSGGQGFSLTSRLREHQGRQFVVMGNGGSRVQDTCEGDSGGPAYLKLGEEWFLLGVLSTGTAGCYGTWSTYTDVGTYPLSDLVPFAE